MSEFVDLWRAWSTWASHSNKQVFANLQAHSAHKMRIWNVGNVWKNNNRVFHTLRCLYTLLTISKIRPNCVVYSLAWNVSAAVCIRAVCDLLCSSWLTALFKMSHEAHVKQLFSCHVPVLIVLQLGTGRALGHRYLWTKHPKNAGLGGRRDSSKWQWLVSCLCWG